MDVRPALLALVALSGCQDPEPPCVPKEVLRGPWSVGFHARRGEVRWETAEDGCGGLRLRVEGSDQWLAQVASTTSPVERSIAFGAGLIEPPDEPGTSTLHRVQLSGLEPATCYDVQVSQREEVVLSRFCTASESPETPIVLAAIGDTNPALGLSDDLFPAMAASSPSAVLHLGDIQYYSSILESWGAWFERSGGLLREAAWLPAVGNHEFESVTGEAGDEDGDLTEYREYFLPLWGDHGHRALGNNFSVRVGSILYILADSEIDDDTNLWAPGGGTWLEQTLAEAEDEADHAFSVLIFHRPVYTRSKYSGGVGRRQQLAQMLDGHRVPVVMSGHAHCYERFDVDGRIFIVSGGGGALPHRCDRDDEDPVIAAEMAGYQQVNATEYHWLKLSQTSAGLTTEVIAADGRVIDRWEVRR